MTTSLVPPLVPTDPDEGSSGGGAAGAFAMQLSITYRKAEQIMQSASTAGDDVRLLQTVVVDLSGLLFETLGLLQRVVATTPIVLPRTDLPLPFRFDANASAAAAPDRLPSESTAGYQPSGAKKRRRTIPTAATATTTALPSARPSLPTTSSAPFVPRPSPSRSSYADKVKASLVAQFHNPSATPAAKAAVAIKLLVKPLPIGRRLLPVTTELRDDFGAKVAKSCFVYVRGMGRMRFTDLRQYLGTLGDFTLATLPFISFIGDRITCFLCADQAVADSLRGCLQPLRGLQVLDRFDVDRPLFAPPSLIVDDAAVARCRTLYIDRISHDIVRCNNLLVATCLHRQVPGVASLVRDKVFRLQGLPQPQRGTSE